MGGGKHGNYVFDLLGQVRRGGEGATEARAKLEEMNQYLGSIPGYEGSKIDIDGASFSDKPVNKELAQVTGYTGLFGPDAKAANQTSFKDFIVDNYQQGNQRIVDAANDVLKKYGYDQLQLKGITPRGDLVLPVDIANKFDLAYQEGYRGPTDDAVKINRYLEFVKTNPSYVDIQGNFTPTGKQFLLAEDPASLFRDNPELKLQFENFIAGDDEFLNTENYKSTPTLFNVDAAKASVSQANPGLKESANPVAADLIAEEVAKTQILSAQQQGLTDYVDAQKGTVDPKSTVQGQLADLMQQFEGGQIPAFVAGAVRVAEQKLAARGMGASSMAGQAILQAAMEASVPIAAADAETYRRMSELNLNNRQQAEVINAQLALQVDLKNLTNEQQVRVANTQNRIEAMFRDQAQENATRQFNSRSDQQTDQFFADLFNRTAQFNAAQQNAINQFNAKEVNSVEEFNSQLGSQREQFELKNRMIIDQANAVYRREINTANTALTNAETEFNVRNAFNVSQVALANILQQHRDELNFARVNALNADEYSYNLALSSFQNDRNLDLALSTALGDVGLDLLGSAVTTLINRISKPA